MERTMAEDKVSQAVEAADQHIQAMCVPDKMTPQEAKDFLEGVAARCDSAVEALEEEHDLT
jgi:hypothetical protein